MTLPSVTLTETNIAGLAALGVVVLPRGAQGTHPAATPGQGNRRWIIGLIAPAAAALAAISVLLVASHGMKEIPTEPQPMTSSSQPSAYLPTLSRHTPTPASQVAPVPVVPQIPAQQAPLPTWAPAPIVPVQQPWVPTNQPWVPVPVQAPIPPPVSVPAPQIAPAPVAPEPVVQAPVPSAEPAPSNDAHKQTGPRTNVTRNPMSFAPGSS